MEWLSVLTAAEDALWSVWERGRGTELGSQASGRLWPLEGRASLGAASQTVARACRNSMLTAIPRSATSLLKTRCSEAANNCEGAEGWSRLYWRLGLSRDKVRTCPI